MVALCALVGVCVVLPGQGVVDEGLEYGYIVSGAKSESVAFTAQAAHEDTYYLFGSSELTTLPLLVSTAPDNVLRDYDCGYQFMYIGEAYDQSLWMAIAAGAHDQSMPNRKVAIIVSMQWFYDDGLEPGIFKMRFSYPLYAEFCANEAIPDETKAYVARRLAEEGVDQTAIDAGLATLPQDYLNDAVFGAMGDLRLRQSLPETRERGESLPSGTEPPDYDQLRQQALEEAQESCSGNEYGIYDEYWDEYIAPVYATRAGELAGETLSNECEYNDLQCFLDVCKACGLEPYVIIMPANGKWYDYAGLPADVREACYARIRTMCADAGVECLDLSVHEYDLYYLRDIMHLGWLGWVDVEEGFGKFIAQDKDGGGTS